MRVIHADEQVFVPASHENPLNPGVLKRVIATRDQLLEGRVQMLNWARLPKGSAFQSHYHEDMEEVFIMVRGTAMMSVDGVEVALGPGDTILVEPREVHRMKNTCAEDVEYIVFGITSGENGKTVVVEGDESGGH